MSRVTEQQERALAEGLRALAATSRHASASRGVAAAVLAEMARREPVMVRTARAWLPIAAALVLAVGASLWVARQAQVPQGIGTIQPAGFVEIPGAAALPPMESGAIVRVAIPVSALPSYGISIAPDFGVGRVEVDLMVAQDGLPRAIRFVNDSNTSRSTP
jgi:hypothetical protein